MTSKLVLTFSRVILKKLNFRLKMYRFEENRSVMLFDLVS